MRYLDEFRDPAITRTLVWKLRLHADQLEAPVTIMEICGTHTMAIHRTGIRAVLPHNIKLVSGPGCPVCVSAVSYIDSAVALSSMPAKIIATFGDMLRVPGSASNLARERAAGASVEVVYSPLDAVSLAQANPGKTVIFLGVGFETTAPTIAGAIIAAQQAGLENFKVLTALKTIPPALLALVKDQALRIDGFLCPGHVSAIIGSNAYLPMARDYGIPCVVAGFETADILFALIYLVQLIAAGKSEVVNAYERFVKPQGNLKAQACMQRVFETADAEWRGLGSIPGSALLIRPEFQRYNAAEYVPELPTPPDVSGCRCGDVLKGVIEPTGCPLFTVVCTPSAPVGPCMVSSEGSCAAFYKYTLTASSIDE